MTTPPRNNRKEDSSPPESQTQPPPPPKHNPRMPSSSSFSSTADNFSSPPSMKPIVFPPGVKFVPTDEELILHYFEPFLRGNTKPLLNAPIHRVNIYDSNPERLSKEYGKGNDKEWFFITERTRVRDGRKHINRSGNDGRDWKVRGSRKIKGVVGYRTGLEYYTRKYASGGKQNWLMQEYWIASSPHNNPNENPALCKLYLTPRIAEKEEYEKMTQRKEEEVQPRNFSSHPSMKPIVFPPGFKFVPDDEDLLLHYLEPFLRGKTKSLLNVPIHCVNIYDSDPEQLSKEYDKGNDKEWFFITERTKLHDGGEKYNRSDNGGSWKVANCTQKIEAGKGVVGYRTGLAYYIGKCASGVKSNWLMHEYWVASSPHNNPNGDYEDHALCKLYLTPTEYKRKAEQEEREKMKKNKEEEMQRRNVAFQQPHQPQAQVQQNLLFPSVSRQIVDFHAFLTSYSDPYPLDGDRESNNTSYLKKSSEKD